MPYIESAARSKYDPLLQQYGSGLENERALVLSGFCWRMGEALYGSARMTRYFLQNEFCGVLFCAAQEWSRRVGGDLRAKPPALGTRVEDLLSGSLSITPLVEALLRDFPREDGTQRAGHLNYIITSLATLLFNQAEEAEIRSVPAILADLAMRWYATETAPYEDAKIRTEGDCYSERLLSLGKK